LEFAKQLNRTVAGSLSVLLALLPGISQAIDYRQTKDLDFAQGVLDLLESIGLYDRDYELHGISRTTAKW